MPYKDPERRREFERQWREQNRELLRQRQRGASSRYAKKHPERVAAQRERRMRPYLCARCGAEFRAEPSLVALRGRRYCTPACARTRPIGRKMHSGYVLVHRPEHPHADRRGYVLEHRLIAESVIGRLLPRTAHVHHVNEIRDDNRKQNLVICQDRGYHSHLHRRMNRLRRERQETHS